MKRFDIHFNQVSEAMSLVDETEVRRVIDILEMVRNQHRRVYVMGNGGSHATASHFVNDLNKMCRVRAYTVGSDVPTVYAYGNDNGWGNMFSDAIAGQIEQGDCAVGFSCSGNSDNVVRALETARNRGAWAVGITGLSKSSEMAKMALDAVVYVPVPDIRVQEDLHLMICHAIVREMQNDD